MTMGHRTDPGAKAANCQLDGLSRPLWTLLASLRPQRSFAASKLRSFVSGVQAHGSESFFCASQLEAKHPALPAAAACNRALRSQNIAHRLEGVASDRKEESQRLITYDKTRAVDFRPSGHMAPSLDDLKGHHLRVIEPD